MRRSREGGRESGHLAKGSAPPEVEIELTPSPPPEEEVAVRRALAEIGDDRRLAWESEWWRLGVLENVRGDD